MRERYYCKKDDKGAYDPQVGAAAAANSAVAQKSEQFNEDFYNKYVAPQLDAMAKQTAIDTEQQGKLFDINYAQTKQAADRYNTLGIPAEDRYYKMVADYSAPEEQETQAQAALGDVRTAAAGQADAQARKFRSLGIDPTSPAALSASTDMSVQNAAVEAAAASRARQAAKTLGMQLTGDAANFGRGGQSGVLGFGGAASGNASAALSGTQGSAQIAPGGASNVNTGLGLAQKAYGSNLDAYTTLNKTSLEHSGDAMAGLGALAGTLGSAAIRSSNPLSFLGSDRRIKKHTKKIATLAHGIGLWLFHYIWDADDAPLRQGYMADEVEPVFPDAVRVGPGGFKMVNYSKVLV
jgi:hypothetical protein